jgi:hypothetical protein
MGVSSRLWCSRGSGNYRDLDNLAGAHLLKGELNLGERKFF